MEALVITLREGMEIALVVGLILAYLNRIGRATLNRYVYAGLVLAVLTSLAGAAGFSRLGFDPENEVSEGTLLAVAAVLVTTLVVWMWRASRGIKRHIETRLEAIASEADGQREGWGLLGFTFFVVLREGVEIVLFLAALSLAATSGLLQLIGGMMGLGLAALFGLLLIKGSVRIDLRRFFGVTGLVLLILVARLLAGSIHEFTEAGILPSTPMELTVIGFFVQDSTSTAILIALFLLPILAMLPGLRSRPERGGPTTG
jgi:FTR1 family protein